jgi:hypothetical protein
LRSWALLFWLKAPETISFGVFLSSNRLQKFDPFLVNAPKGNNSTFPVKLYRHLCLNPVSFIEIAPLSE